MTTRIEAAPDEVAWKNLDEYGDGLNVTYEQFATAEWLRKRYPTLTRGISHDRLASIFATIVRGDAGKPWHS